MTVASESLKTADPRKRYYCKPCRIIRISNSERVLGPMHLMDDSPNVCTIRTETQPEGIVLDFGVETHGGLQILVCATSNSAATGIKVPIRIRLGESVSEVMGTPDNDHALNMIETVLPCQSRSEIGQTGFRFANVEILSPDTTIEIRHIKAVELKHPWPYLGTFNCSDPEINEIWKVAARTVHLCCQDHIWDGIKRDRVAWSGDLHPQVAAVACVFGNRDIVPETLRFIAEQTSADCWINNIGSYSLWWVISLHEWYRYTGDLKMLRNLRNELIKIFSRVLEYITPDGQENMPGRRYIDWPSHGKNGDIDTAIQALCVWAVKSAWELFDALDDRQNFARLGNILKNMKALPQKDSSHLQTLAIRVHAGLENAQKANDIISANPYNNISPWFGYYVLNARAEANDIDGCLEMLRKYWGGMLRLGATTFWEHYDTSWEQNTSRIDEIPTPGRKDVHAEYGSNCYVGWRHSLCHGWSSGPCAWLSRYVLGIVPLEPGYTKVKISPKLGDLSFAEGTFPTPNGIIKVSHRKKSDGSISSQVESNGQLVSSQPLQAAMSGGS